MPRTTDEWRGKTDDTAIPARVRLRVFETCNGLCGSCQRKLYPGDKWDCDHCVALVNGGEHRESNLRVLCAWCHKSKTRQDIATKSASYKRRLSHAGIKRTSSRPMPGSRNSPWKKTFNHGVVHR